MLYYFATVPILIPNKIFKELRSWLGDLIWGSARHRAPLTTLSLPLTDGGLAAPDYEAYYLASQLQWLMPWLAKHPPAEARFLWPIVSRNTVLRSVLSQTVKADGMPLLIRTISHCWHRYLGRRKLRYAYAPDLPLCALPGTQAFVVMVGQLFSDGIVLPFANLCEQTCLNNGQFLTHAAMLASVWELWGHFSTEPIADPTLSTILTWSSRHHRTTNLYRAITKTPQPTLLTLKTTWADDLQVPLTDRDWAKILIHIPRISRNARL